LIKKSNAANTDTAEELLTSAKMFREVSPLAITCIQVCSDK